MKKAPFYAKLFECKSCDFKCSKKSDWNRHLFTAKHLNRTNIEQNYAEKSVTYKCSYCCREYTARRPIA